MSTRILYYSAEFYVWRGVPVLPVPVAVFAQSEDVVDQRVGQWQLMVVANVLDLKTHM